jgi:hypothetical protein
MSSHGSIPTSRRSSRQGKVAPGFDMDAVKLALGDPDRVTIHTDATGSHQIWHYVTYEDYQGGIIYAGYYHRYRGWGGPYFYGASRTMRATRRGSTTASAIVFTTGNNRRLDRGGEVILSRRARPGGLCRRLT